MLFFGVDVQSSRSCSWAALDANYVAIDSGWLDGDNAYEVSLSLLSVLENLGGPNRLVVAIDAPRMPLPHPRRVQWSPRTGWVPCAGLRGRHCDLLLKNLGLANPQWTPTEDEAPNWMHLGFTLFRAIQDSYQTFEVFPSASYRMLTSSQEPKIHISFKAFAPGPKDMLDAYIAALTVGEYLAGRGCHVGGGDGLGEIILPRSCTPRHPDLQEWPQAE